MAQERRVLVVDDEYTVRFVLGRTLERAGWTVVTAETAERGRACLRQGLFDLILIDKNLPGMSGIELLREVRRFSQRVFCVVITAYASVDGAVEALSLEADGYIEKPFTNIFGVVEKLEAMMARPRRVAAPARARAPIAHEREDDPLAQAVRPAAGATQLDPPRALVVGPSEKTNASVQEALSELFDGRVTCVGDAEAKDALRTVSPRICVLDGAIGWPRVLMLVRASRTLGRAVDCVVLRDEEPCVGTVSDLIDLGVRVLMEKPPNTAVLTTRVDYLLALR